MTNTTDSSDYFWTINTTTTWFSDDLNNNETLGIDWDDWDVSLWTPEQRQLLEGGAIPRQVHITLGILLTFIVLFGFTANSTILYVFSR
jgi:r-opsin